LIVEYLTANRSDIYSQAKGFNTGTPLQVAFSRNQTHVAEYLESIPDIKLK